MVNLQADGIQEFRARRQRLSHVAEFKQQVVRLSLLVFFGAALMLVATVDQYAEANLTGSSQPAKNLGKQV
eukprot:gene7328-7395_t